jgi:hypothetical protein
MSMVHLANSLGKPLGAPTGAYLYKTGHEQILCRNLRTKRNSVKLLYIVLTLYGLEVTTKFCPYVILSEDCPKFEDENVHTYVSEKSFKNRSLDNAANCQLRDRVLFLELASSPDADYPQQ